MSTQAPTPPPAPRTRIDAKGLSARWQASVATVNRRQREADFPQPHFLSLKRLWWLDEIEEYESRRMAQLADKRVRARVQKNAKHAHYMRMSRAADALA